MIGPVLVHGVGAKMTRRFAAVVIASQSLAVFFGALVAYAIAGADGDSGHTAYLWIGVALAVACIVAAGTLRKPWGVTLGWLIQIATLASAVVVGAMLFVGLIFLALWVTALVQGRKMDQLTADYLKDHHELA